MDFVGGSEESLSVLSDKTKAYIGRKKAIQSKYGEEGALLIGRSVEKQNYGKKVYLDGISPHVIFVCGARGSGKSYDLGVIAEELITKNPNVACVVIDPIGVFWSMKYPNREDKEIEALGEWGLEPRGLDKLQVFVPAGMKKRVPPDTYDRLFSIRPVELTADEWCLTFGIERFAPIGLLLEKVIEKADEKYKGNYSIEDLISIAQKDPELTSRDRGYKSDTRRALVSRLEAAKVWGVFAKDGTSLAEVCKEGHLSVIDISFLEENVASLVIGILARKILNARKLVTRKVAMEKHEMKDIDELLNVEIPPTWLFIDEAHTLIPGGAWKTAATDSLIEYVKQGRRPGCSLVFATQQPSAIDTRVLSQLDMLLCHKLVFDDDLKAVMKRMPTLLPKEYEKTRFIKTLPIGIALTGDRSDQTSRAFCIQIRPRLSQHEGRETTSVELDENVEPAKIRELVITLIHKNLEDQGRMPLAKVEEITDTMNRRYDTDLNSGSILDALVKEKGCEISDGEIRLKGFKEAPEEIEEKQVIEPGGKASALKVKLGQEDAKKLAEKRRKKKSLGLFGREERVEDMKLVYEPLYKLNYDLLLDNGFKPTQVFISDEGEVYYWSNGLKKTSDMNKVVELDRKKLEVLSVLGKSLDSQAVAKKTKQTAQGTARTLRELVVKGLATESKEKKYKRTKKLDIPDTIDDVKFYGVESKLDLEAPRDISKEKSYVDEKKLRKIPSLFGNVKTKDIEVLWKPVWMATFRAGDHVRVQKFDAC